MPVDAGIETEELMGDGRAEAKTDGLGSAEPGGTVGIREEPDSAVARSSREERYRELLRAPVTAVPADPSRTKSSAQPGLPERTVPAVMEPAGNKRTNASRVPRQQPSRAEVETSGDDAANDGREASDADSDVTPPQLLSATFNPQEVQDGDLTTFVATVTDNLSGVQSVSGVITSPVGSTQGFSAQRDGLSDQYVAAITIPRDAPEGVWHVRHLTLTDKARNRVTLNYTQGALPPTASFRVVSSASDSTGPVLKAVWLDRPAMRGGERNSMFVQAEDDKAGVALVSGVFVSPSRTARIGVGCRAGTNDIWECSVTPPPCIDCGLWRLEQIQLQDKANNMATFRAHDQIVRSVLLDISGDLCDATPPVINAIALDPPVVSNIEGGIITIRAILHDEGCGVASASGLATAPGGIGGQRAPFSFEPSGDGRTFIGRIVIQKHAAKGTWQISWIQAVDKGHNLRAYSTSNPAVAAATFRVE